MQLVLRPDSEAQTSTNLMSENSSSVLNQCYCRCLHINTWPWCHRRPPSDFPVLMFLTCSLLSKQTHNWSPWTPPPHIWYPHLPVVVSTAGHALGRATSWFYSEECLSSRLFPGVNTFSVSFQSTFLPSLSLRRNFNHKESEELFKTSTHHWNLQQPAKAKDNFP